MIRKQVTPHNHVEKMHRKNAIMWQDGHIQR